MPNDEIPQFDFEPAAGYAWLIERGLVGFDANTALQPWHYLAQDQVFDLRERWPRGQSSSRLVAFARRQDSDDLACFEVVSGAVASIVVVHGWTAEGYQVDANLSSFWDWLKMVIDDIADWIL